MIKILHFITDTNIGGAGNLLCNQIKGLNKKQFAIFVALPKGSLLIQRLKSLPCRIIECKYGADKSLSIESINENYQIIKKVNPDIVHSHGSLSSRIAATISKIPCRIFTRHCAPPLSKIAQNSLIKFAFKVVNDVLSTAIIAPSEFAKQNLIEMGASPQKIATIINGASPLRTLDDDEKEFLRARYGLEKENFVISYFARLEEIKGHKTLLEAAKICKKWHPNFRFLIVGSGHLEKNLKEYAQYLDVCDVVHFVGFQNDVAPIFNITDINLNCSYGSETAPLSLSEGMSLGTPSITSHIGGNPYMVKNEENGLLFPAHNPESLADAIIRLYYDKKLYTQCSIGALTRYKTEFNDKLMCQKMNDFYLTEYRKAKTL
jgi:glycosyltransferase involved in cell wall biosynthesis